MWSKTFLWWVSLSILHCKSVSEAKAATQSIDGDENISSKHKITEASIYARYAPANPQADPFFIVTERR
jgi:hypothetical protein